MWTSILDAAINRCEAQLIELRRHLHAHPEVSGEEFETSQTVFQWLHNAGIEARILPSGRGVIAELPAWSTPDGNHSDNASAPLIALRADIDALRIQDEKPVGYASRRSGVMHACGHDGHTAATLGAVVGLHELMLRDALPCPLRVRAIFQPAEETATGANEMIAAGALDEVEAIFALHLDPARQVGRIGIRYGALTAACDDVEIHIEGRGGHAARPHQTRDPIAAAAQLISALYQTVPRATDSNDSVVLTIGQISAGHNANVIPESALLKGTLRTLDASSREATRRLIARVASGVAEISDTQISVSIGEGPPSVINNALLSGVLQSAATDLIGENNVDIIAAPSMGGEDFAFYLSHAPGAMFRLGCALGEATSHPLHSSSFDIDERALAIGSKTLARAAVLWARENQR